MNFPDEVLSTLKCPSIFMSFALAVKCRVQDSKARRLEFGLKLLASTSRIHASDDMVQLHVDFCKLRLLEFTSIYISMNTEGKNLRHNQSFISLVSFEGLDCGMYKAEVKLRSNFCTSLLACHHCSYIHRNLKHLKLPGFQPYSARSTACHN